jgi:hypothetical protein
VFSDSLQVFVISNGDVLTGCYPLKPVGNVLKDSLEIRRECPGCTCGVESSLAIFAAAVSSSSYLLLKNTQVTPIQMRKTPAHRWPVTRSPRKNFPPSAPAT